MLDTQLSVVQSFIKTSESELYKEYQLVRNYFYTSEGITHIYKSSNDWDQGKKLCDQAIARCEKIINECGTLISSQNGDKNNLKELEINVTTVYDMFKREKELADLNHHCPGITSSGLFLTIGMAALYLRSVSNIVVISSLPGGFDLSDKILLGVGLSIAALGYVYPKFKFIQSSLDNTSALLFMKAIEFKQKAEVLDQKAVI